MKASLLFGFVSLALLPLTAAESFEVNKLYKGPVTSENNTQTLTAAATLSDAHTTILTATLAFTLPSETPVYSEVTSEKLAIAADTDGTILVADGASKAWVETDCTVTDSAPIDIKAVGKTVNGKLTFDVTLGTGDDAKTVTVTSPAAGTTLSTLSFTGEGSASDITLALVDTAILPAPDGGSQDADQVAKYVTWVNDTDKGGAMNGATDAAKSDAFAMNVGGTPKLEITGITPETLSENGTLIPGTVTVKGTYTKPTGTDADAPLGAINGKLYITYAETLSGTPQSKVADIPVQTEEAITITLPEGARFVKARVALTPPPAEL